MSGDKRSIEVGAIETLGTIISEGAGRDAIHVAVEPCIAGELLEPGEHVGIVDGFAYCNASNLVGIVDPFLEDAVDPGQRFWMLVYPRTITSLRHVWSHPDIPDTGTARAVFDSTPAESEEWLRDFCKTSDCPDYEDLMKAIDRGGTTTFESKYSRGDDWSISIEDEYVMVRNSDAHSEIPDVFWDHVEVVLGKKFANRPKYFSCSC